MEPLKITTFDELQLEKAKEVVAFSVRDGDASRWKFYQGDHWQDGDAWVGPLLEANSPGAAEMKAEVERSFVFANVSREITDRHADAVTNREPRWGGVLKRVLREDELPTDDETARIGELDGLMTSWWDSPMRCTYTDEAGALRACGVHELLQKASRRYAATGRFNLRIFIPPANIDASGVLPKKPLADALNRIFVELCEPEYSTIYIDRRRMQQVGIYIWREGEKEFAELSYLADDGSTILRQVVNAEDQNTPEGDAPKTNLPIFPLGGNLLHFEAAGDALLSDSIIAQQKDANRTLTMGGRAMNLSGFPERVLYDVQLDGEFVDDPKNQGKKKFIPYSPTLGAATINNFTGIEYREGGETKRTTPRYERLDPPGTRIFDEAVTAAARRIRDEAKQSHVEMSSDATSSGRSREQARWEFIQSLSGTISSINSAGRWLLATVFALAAATSSDGAARFDDFKFEFACRIDAGPLSPEERKEDREQVKSGLLSKEIAMTRGGVDDTDAENGRIAGEEAGSLSTMEQRAKITQVLAAAGAGVQAAAIVAGFDSKQAAQLGRSDFVDNEDDPNPQKTES